jgi:hypothetical protein
MVSYERHAVSPASAKVMCPLRDREVSLDKCLACGRLVDRDPADPPKYIVCDAKLLVGWLGLDDL